MVHYTLVDDIQNSNTCILVQGTLADKDTTVEKEIPINNFTDVIDYINGTYGNNMFGFIVTTHRDYSLFCKKIIDTVGADLNKNTYSIVVPTKDKSKRYFTSDVYKYAFDTNTGVFMRWGATIKDDPLLAPMGPEIADIEISTICHGIDSIGPCPWCYKSNNSNGHNMSLKEYQKVLSIVNQYNTLLQIAFGIGDIDGNPELEQILKHTRDNGIIPNITINGARMNDTYYEMLARYCGAVSVSRYNNDVCFDAVERLCSYLYTNDDRYNLSAVNIHQLLSEDTYDDCMKLIDLYKTDKRISKLNAIVFLSLKPIGIRNKFSALSSREKYIALIEYAMKNDVPIGFDSCGCYNFLNSFKKSTNYSEYQTVAEACESTLFSIYVNVHGEASPCSFTEECNHTHFMDSDEMKEHIILKECGDLLMDVWYSKKFNYFRRALLKTIDNNELHCRSCPAYSINFEE